MNLSILLKIEEKILLEIDVKPIFLIKQKR